MAEEEAVLGEHLLQLPHGVVSNAQGLSRCRLPWVWLAGYIILQVGNINIGLDETATGIRKTMTVDSTTMAFWVMR